MAEKQIDSMETTAKTASMGDGDSGDKIKDAPKPSKRITRKDWQKVQMKLKNELEDRKRSSFRESHEAIWREVDRQIAMQPMIAINRDGSEVDTSWHNTIELGELSKASENISADVRRIMFPNARFWFEPHSTIPKQFDQQGKAKTMQKLQEGVDGRLRSFMMQQHADFGLKDRVELSIKEALHHGSFVTEVRWQEQEMVYEGTKVKVRGSPVWVPYSMWNCYPDPSPSVVASNMFYEGSMFIESYLPRYLAEQWVKSGEEGFLPSQWTKVPKDEHVVSTGDSEARTKDVKITTYWGDVVIERSDESLYFPNHKAMLMNGIIVYMNPNTTPYIPIIYRGYERPDVRDPYYTSPIIKQSPLQKLASALANKAMDGIELSIEPPIVYDGNDPDFVLNGGPVIAPGSKTSSKGSNAFQQVEIGDPKIALEGLQLCLSEMKEKLGRPGRAPGDRATKAEVVKNEQDQEVSLVGFIDKLEVALRSYLYMQHVLNVAKCKEYDFFSPEMGDPDVIRIKKEDIPPSAHFEVVGARGVLGEQERTQKMSMTTAFAAQYPQFAQRLDVDAILLQMYQDDGVKNPERFLVQQGEQNPAMLMQQLQQAKQMLQKIGGLLQQEKQKTQVKMAKIEADQKAKGAKIESDHATKLQKIQSEVEVKMLAMKADMTTEMMKLLAEKQQHHEKLYAEMMGKLVDVSSRSADKQQDRLISDGGDLKNQLSAEFDKMGKQLVSAMKEPRTKSAKAKKSNGEWHISVSDA